MLELEELYKKLRDNFGYLNWWPGDTKVEIVVGAILTQNTAWKNVEKAIKNLRERKMLSLERLASTELKELEDAIRPSGFYKQKGKKA
jgi:Uncharacterized protein related to Endonuclease III